MIIEISAIDLRSGRVPDRSPRWLKFADERVVVTGHLMGYPEIYVYHSPDLAIVGDSSTAVLGRVRELERDLTLSNFGMSMFLHHGFIPPPYTEWEEIVFLGMGSRGVLTANPSGLEFTHDSELLYLEANSRGSSDPSTETVLDLLTAAVDRSLAEAGGSGLLMMSSGKDSVSVAVALAEGGHQEIPCVTYRADESNTEDQVAAEICKRIGLEHRTLVFPTDPSVVQDHLIRFFEGSPRPCGDLVQIPYAMAVGTCGTTDGAVLDGSGNDAYMGYFPGSDLRKKLRYRIRSEKLGQALERMIPIESPINYLTRSRVATWLPGRTLRLSETSRFYADVVDTRPWWYQMSQDTSHISDIELGGAVLSPFEDQAIVHMKATVAAAAFGMEAKLPFTDEKFVDYFFNLPREHRYDPETEISKVLLRQMLLETIGYDAEQVGKHYFNFAGEQFLRDNREFVLSEITSCALWTDDIAALATGWMDRLERRPMVHHALLMLFQLSGWHNHSRYVR